MSEENKMEEFVSYVENMTVLELSKLVKTLEERLGVSAAAPVAVAAAAPAAAAALFGAGAGGGGPFPACGLLLCSGHGISSFLNKQGMDEPCLAQRLVLWNRLFYRVISGTMIPAIREPRPTTQQ